MVSTPLLVAALVVSGLMLALVLFSVAYARWLRNGGRLFLGSDSSSSALAPVDLTNEHGEIDPIKQIKHLKKTTAEFGIKYSELVFGKMLGKGSQGEVFRATWRGSQVAVKKVDTRKVPPEIIEEFCQEAHIMRRLRHPSLTLFMGVSLEHPHLCILTELCSRGSLFDIIHDEHAALTWPKCLVIALDVAKGMTYLHAHSPPILHRDLKSLNILVDQNWRGKVADFGMTRFQEDGTMTQCGSPLWMAPEMIRNDPYAEKSDVFSFGICLWEMYTRKIPYRDLGLNPSHLVVKVVKEHLRPPIPKQCPKGFRNLMEKCWAPLPEKRPTFPQILKILEAFVADPAIVNHKPMSSRDATIIVRPDKIEPEQPYATAGGEGGGGGAGGAAGGILGISSAERGWKVDPAELHFYNDAQVLFQEAGAPPADGTVAASPSMGAKSKGAAELKDDSDEAAAAAAAAANNGGTTPTSKSGAKKKSSSSSSSSDKKKSSSSAAKNDAASASAAAVSSADLSIAAAAAAPAGTPAPLSHNTNIKATKDAKDDDLVGGYNNSNSTGSGSGGGAMAPQGAGTFLAKFRNKLVSIKPCFLDSSHLQLSNEERVMADLEGKDKDSKLSTFMRRMAGLRHPNIVLFLGAYIEPVEALKAKLKDSGQLAGSVLDDQPFGAAASSSAAAAPASAASAAASAASRPPPPGCEYYLGSVTEFMSRGTLHDVLCDSSLVLDWATMIQLLLDAAAGMAYLHGNRPHPVIHQDFTSRRLLVDKNWRVRVGEYAFVDLNLALSSASNPTAVLPPSIWSAPEYIKHPNTTNASMAGNVYSFGCLMWQAMVRRPLWDDRALTKELSDKIVKQGDRPPLPESFGSKDLKNLIEKCWMASPAARPSFVQILEELTRLKALGPPKIHLTLGVNAHKYRKAKTVFAYRSKDPVTILKDWGTNLGKRNCLVLFSGEDDVYLCDEEVFMATYEPLDQGEGELELDPEVQGQGGKRGGREEDEKKEGNNTTKQAPATAASASSAAAAGGGTAPGSPSSSSPTSPVDPLLGHHEWRKTGTVLAKLMEEAFSVRTDTGATEHGMAGDYLVQDMAGKDQWSVEAKTFLELYERWD